MELYFVLNEDGEPLLEPDVKAWSRWFAQADRTMARSTISPDITVFTTFNGVDEVVDPDSIPRLFETRVFGGVLDGEVVHGTRAEAIIQHAELVEWCRIGNSPDAGITEADLL